MNNSWSWRLVLPEDFNNKFIDRYSNDKRFKEEYRFNGKVVYTLNGTTARITMELLETIDDRCKFTIDTLEDFKVQRLKVTI